MDNRNVDGLLVLSKLGSTAFLRPLFKDAYVASIFERHYIAQEEYHQLVRHFFVNVRESICFSSSTGTLTSSETSMASPLVVICAAALLRDWKGKKAARAVIHMWLRREVC